MVDVRNNHLEPSLVNGPLESCFVPPLCSLAPDQPELYGVATRWMEVEVC